MSLDRVEIIREIQRLAQQSGGSPPGAKTFASATGTSESEWKGKYWARWGDAVREAGFQPNKMTEAFGECHLLEQYARLALTTSRLPGTHEIKVVRQQDKRVPSWDALKKRFGTKAALARKVMEFCRPRADLAPVIPLCVSYLQSHENSHDERMADDDHGSRPSIGYVYLIQHGARREYKIGRTNNALRREGEIGVELPEKAQPIHVIETDDPAGIEAYWHKRFAEKRKNGEWFALSAGDVAAFKRRRTFM